MEIKYAARKYHIVIEKIRQKGQRVVVDGNETLEMLYPTLLVRNPLDRVVPHPERKMNVAFAIAEWISMMTGDDDIKLFTQFISGYDRFSTDGKKLDGAYGARLQSKGDAIKQCIEMLKKNPETRRAVAPIFAPGDLFGEGRTNTPCTLSMHFLSRRGLLNCATTMRSNDVYLGLPNDMFVFTMVQEFVATQAGLRLGVYVHNPHSLHIYTKDIPKLSGVVPYWWPAHMTPMPRLFDYDQVHMLYLIVKNYLTDKEAFWYMVTNDAMLRYTKDLAFACRAIRVRKSDPTDALKCFRAIEDSMLRRSVRNWMPLESKGVLLERE